MDANHEHRVEELSLSESLGLSDTVSWELKTKVEGHKRARKEVIGGEFISDSGRRVSKRRVIDRVNDWYEELIVDVATGEVWRAVSEPLRIHRTSSAGH
jgi:hypothetical protein